MKEKDLKLNLQQNFNFTIWKGILPLLFKKIDYFTHPENLFSENEKVIDGKQIGIIKLDDGKQLAIFTVEVADGINIVRNRQGLREIAAKYIDQNITHGSLAFFYNKNQSDYRFSFIAKEASIDLETGQLIKGETKPKRYTYLLGPNEACTTAAKRLLLLANKRENGQVNIKELKEVFSVEALNKDFFKSYKAHYEKFAKYLTDDENILKARLIDKEKESQDQQEKPIRDFVKKLLGRIVFLQFLEKKGWMGCDSQTKDWLGGNPRFMIQLFESFSNQEKFHSQCLTKLFFETLNTKRTNDIFEVKELQGKINGSRVPYLNGGLFEPEKNKATLEIDFPPAYFQELLDFFDQYNFTIDENSPDDHEVGIDPEMLGHIFENLLEDNRGKGAFYTPKEIVQYMCKESLIQYLLNTFHQKTDIEHFIRLHKVSSFLAEKENALLLNQKLDDIKVCDPAIGSGAFPIGMLQEIFEAKRFIYPYLRSNVSFEPAEVKKNIIQHSIYGVDLEKGAVDIAQLRFWLSLVVDEINPQPLPNLDYKIMQGNSLLEQYEGIDLGNEALFAKPQIKVYQASMFEEPTAPYGFSDEQQADIKDLIDRYFKVEDKAEKAFIHKKIDEIVVAHIDKSLEFYDNRLLIEIETYQQLLNRKLERLKEHEKQQVISRSKEPKEIAKRTEQRKNIIAARKRLLDFEVTDERPYFLWHLYFKDVFEQGGFDVMIGNPPYIQLQSMGPQTDLLQEIGLETFTRTGDLYCLFYEKGIQLLKDKGILSYITSNKWMRAAYGKPLRKFFNNYNPIHILDLGQGVFHSATVDTNILSIQKSPNQKNLKGILIENNKDLSNISTQNIIPVDVSEDEIWSVLSIQDYNIKVEIEKCVLLLKDWKINIYRGITSGCNEAFEIDEETYLTLIKDSPINNKIIKPVLRGRDISKYSSVWSKNYLLFIPWHFPLNNNSEIKGASLLAEEKFETEYPKIYRHLFNFKSKLESRNQAETGIRYEWYALQRFGSNFWGEFEKEKIIYQEMVQTSSFCYDPLGQFYCFDTARIITGEKLKYLLSILNSKIFFFAVKYFYGGGGLGDTGIRMKHTFFENCPVPISHNYEIFEKLSDYLIYLNDPKQAPVLEKVSNEAVSQVFEDLVNMMVYELYFEEEMKAKEIDVLQFVNEKAFPGITKAEDKKAIIQKVYYELQEKDNPIRNRILVASSRSETIARINAATS